eukprot:TRINITY_DN24530_c0_g1_i1.p1 TRINITY_DN24530_c0_g1~~TRINITY_DN24530_c0_g1_i1.p1  ORF type:complete len:143 (+),score=50.51 TRINITY_DN24530_c0_g1_i1:72-500(+)
MQLFRTWVAVLGLFELAPLTQLLLGSRVHEMAPAFFPTKQSDEFHLWYGWFLITLTACRLTLAADMTNKAVFRLNIVLHAVECVMFAIMAKTKLLPRIAEGALLKGDKAVTESTVIFGVVCLNALLFPLCYRSHTSAKRKTQ